MLTLDGPSRGICSRASPTNATAKDMFHSRSSMHVQAQIFCLSGKFDQQERTPVWLARVGKGFHEGCQKDSFSCMQWKR